MAKTDPNNPFMEGKPEQIYPKAANKADSEESAKKAFLEVQIRKFIKPNGGFRKNLHEDFEQKAKRWIKQWNDIYKPTPPRTVASGWDRSIHVKGYDNCDHIENQRHVQPRFPTKAS